MNYPTELSVLRLLPARCATGAFAPVEAGVSNETGEGAGGAPAPRGSAATGPSGPVEQAICCADCDDELDAPDILCASCAEALADVAHGERVAALERELEQVRRELVTTQQSLVQARHTIQDQRRKIQRLLPATPPPPVPESDVVRFITLTPTDTLGRLAGQERVESLVNAGWQIHSMTTFPGDTGTLVVLLTHPGKSPAAPPRPAFVPRRLPGSRRRASAQRAAVDDHRDDARTYITGASERLVLHLRDEAIPYAEAIRAPQGTFTDAELDEIVTREVHAAAQRALEGALDTALTDGIARLQTRRTSNAAH